MKRAKLNSTIVAIAILLAGAVPVFVNAQACTATTNGAGNCDTTNSGATVVQTQLANGQTSQTQIAVPQGFGGIFSCNQNGAYAMSVGALGATGGVYVPVADASVELNTGTLVYKECVLREVIDAQRQAATAGFTQQATQQVQTGRGGAPLYVVNEGKEITAVRTAAFVAALKNGTGSLDPQIKNTIIQAAAQGYSLATYNGPSTLTCPYAGTPANFTNRNTFSWDTILAVGSDCNPIFGYISTNDMALSAAASAAQYQQDQWNWGGGFYSVTDGNQDPLQQQIETPASLVNSSYTQVIQSPFNQLQNANDIGQMVGALFAGISTQVLSSNGGGLTGLTQPIGNSPSYLSQAIQQTTQNLQGAISNAALTNLQAALTVEQSYNKIMNAIASNLTGSINQYRSAENQCWQQIIQSVCATPLSSNNTCPAIAGQCTTDPTTGIQTCPQGQTLKVATSTAFSQAAINAASIPSLASTTINNINISNQALSLLNQLVQNVSGTSADSQAVAIAQLNSLVASGQLHTQSDITTAQNQQQSVQTAMQNGVQNTVTLWAGTNPNDNTQTNIPWDGSVSPGTGWCNFKNQTTLNMWIQKWSS
ncbi:MAG TPA: hypothetical protein VMU25_02330 [Candidatus Paceibacterota bacterium]|nr:hypothetical protein [Candidatus Paceibacterota bacterium]